MATKEERAAAKAAKAAGAEAVVVNCKGHRHQVPGESDSSQTCAATARREFSAEVHGPKFVELAEEYAKTHEGKVEKLR